MATQKSLGKIEVGWKAPDFTLFDNQMKRRNLKEFLNGNLILAFFPGAFTSVCTREVCTFRDSLARLGTFKASVVGISVNDPWSSRAFAEKNMLNFPLLCDYNREVVKLYGLELQNFAGLPSYTVAKRSVLILDKTGTVRFVWISEDPSIEPNYADIERFLQETVQ
jgi:glutaredoxin-dependent peroxiredoxin